MHDTSKKRSLSVSKSSTLLPLDQLVVRRLSNSSQCSGLGGLGPAFHSETENLLYSSKNTLLVFPLHQAAQAGNVEELKAILRSQQGNPMKQDYKGKTALHYTANYPNHQKSLLMTTEIMNSSFLIDDLGSAVELRIQLINTQDSNGETPLHLAAKSGNRKVVQMFLFSSADVNIKSNEGLESLELIYANVPQAMCAVFDRAISCKSGEIHEDNFEVEIDFGAIVGYEVEGEEGSPFQIETELLAYALQSSEGKCKEILVHPLVQLFLHFKWKKIRILFWSSIIFHILWLLIYSKYLLDLYLNYCPYLSPNDSSNFGNTSSEETENETLHCASGAIKCPGSSVNVKTAMVSTTVSVLILLMELYELCTVPSMKYYFTRLENLGELLLILLAILTSLPVWTYMAGSEDFAIIFAWQYEAAAFGVFLAWILILGQIGKTPRLGIYVLILLKVLKSFGMFIVTFLSLLTAFALSFSIIMPQNQAFKTWPRALSKVLVMMTGELNYDEVFYNEEGDETPIPFLISGHIFFATFTIMVTIILFNLLIGFTVSDIQGLQKIAKVSGLLSRLEQIYLMESFLFSKHMLRLIRILRINAKFLNKFLVTSMDENNEIEPVVIPTKLIPKNLQNEVKELATQNLISYPNENTGISQSEKEDLKTLIKSIVKEVLKQQLNSNTIQVDS